MLFPTTIAGSLPKPEWLAEPNKLWPTWRSTGDELVRAKRDATLLAVKMQEDAGIDIVTEGEQGGSILCMAFWSGSKASISPTRSRWVFATIATKRWCRRWSRRCGSTAAFTPSKRRPRASTRRTSSSSRCRGR